MPRRRPASPAASRARVLPRVLAVAALVILPGCGTSAQDASSSAPPAATDSPASDAGGSPAGSRTPAPTISVLPPEQEVAVADACTGEGGFTLTAGRDVDPALPERAGSALHLALTEVGQDQHGAYASLTASLDGDAPVPVAPAHIGERFTADMWTFSVTSICADQVELDLID